MSFDGSIKFDTKLDNKGFEKGIKTLKGVSSKAFGAVKAGAKATAAAIGVIGVASLKVGSDFEAGMSEVKAISGATGKEFDALKDKAKEMGATTKFSATESAEALKYMGMAGWKSEQMLAGLPGVMNLAAASGEELGAVSDIVTDALSAFKMEAEEASKFADLLASTSTNSNTDVAMMGETFKYVAPVAGALGYSAEDAALGIGLMANAGIKASQSGTALRGMMTRMVKPTKESGEAMKMLGVEITDSNDQMKPFKQVMEEIRSGMKNFTPEIQAQIAAMLAGQQGMSGLLAIVNATEEDFSKLTDVTRDYNGAAKEMADIMNDNLKGDVVLLKSALEGLGIEIYESSGFAREFIQSLTGIIEVISNTISGPTQVAQEFEQLSESLGGAQLALNGTEEHMKDMKFGLEAITDAIADMITNGIDKLSNALPGVITIASSIMSSLVDSIMENKAQLSSSIADLITSIIELFIVNVPKFMAVGLDIITGVVTGISENLPELATSLQGSLSMLVESITNNLPLLMEAGANIMMTIGQGIINNLPTIITTGMDIIRTIAQGIIENLPLILETGAEILLGIAKGIGENLPELITIAIELIISLADSIIENIDLIILAGLEIMLGLAQGIADNLPVLIENIPRIINDFAAALTENIVPILKAALQIIIALGKGLIQAIPTLIANIPAIILAIINAFMLYNWWKLGKNIIKGIGTGIKNMGKNLWKTAKDVAKGTVDAIKSWFKNGTKEGSGLIKNLIGGIKSLLGKLISLAKEIAVDVLKKIKDGFVGIADIGKDLIEGLWNGILGAKDWLLGNIKNFAGSVISGFKDFFDIHSPSRVMRDQIGTELIRGIGVGIQQETPALRKLSEVEMMKLVDDYARYGQKAAEAYGQLNKEEMAELRKQHIKERKITKDMTQKEINEVKKQRKEDGKAMAEAVAEGIRAKTDSVVQALEQLRQASIQQLDKLGEATIKALETKYREEEKLTLDNINNRLEKERSASKERISLYEKEHKIKLQLLDSETNSEVNRLQDKIDSINKQLDASKEAQEKDEYEEKLAAAKEKVRVAKTNRDRIEAQKEVDKLISDQKRKEFEKQKKDEIKSLEDQITNVKDSAKTKEELIKEQYEQNKANEEMKLADIEANLEKEREITENHYKTLLKEEQLQAEARRLILDENNKDLINLLDTYNPRWHDAGQSFGESLIDGLNSMKYEIQDVVDDILGMVATAEMANAQIIQAKLDYEKAKSLGDKAGMDSAHKRAERYRNMGGSIGSDTSLKLNDYNNQLKDRVASENMYSKGVTQNITIVSPQNTPSENARLMKRKGEELAFGY